MLKVLIFLLLSLFLVFRPAVSNAVEITSPFGWRIHPISGEWSFHSGVDIGYDMGTPIYAMMSGRVVYAAWHGGFGNCIIIQHDNGDHTLYGHCATLDALYGHYVSKGERIATVGSTGYSTGPHLHLEWWHKGKYADPLKLLDIQ